MDDMSMLPLPKELSNPFFFSSGTVWVPPIPSDFKLTCNFLYELYFYNGYDVFKPWKNTESVVPISLKEWEKAKAKIEELHHKREKAGVLEQMKKGIGILLQLIFWSNDRPVVLLEPFVWDPLKYKPVNIAERYHFIVSRPNLYHSFIQLSELIGEQQKLFSKKLIMKKDV